MNIKITKEQSDKLKQYRDFCVLFGSEDGEDKDFLYVVKPNYQMDLALNRDHFLFYKDEELNEDNLFTTPRCLISGLVTGSSTLLYELLIEGKLEGTYLGDIDPVDFETYKLAKAFLGIAQRDLGQAKKSRIDSVISKKMFWVKKYKRIVNDMLFKVDYNLPIEDLRGEIKNLPKAVDYMDVICKYNNLLPQSRSISEFNDLGEVYYNNWKETL